MRKFIKLSGFLFLLKSLGTILLCVLSTASLFAQDKHDTTSYIQTVDIQTGKIDTILVAKGDYEAPNWHPGNYLVVNFRGKMYKLALATKALTVINTGSINQLMDDHGLSPDGKWMAITNTDAYNPAQKLVKFSFYVVPVTGGEPKK